MLSRSSLLLATLLAVLFLAGWSVAFQAPAHAGGPPGSGDADCSGTTDSRDALLVLQVEARLLLISDICASAANVHIDSSIDSRDATFILQFEAGLLPLLPPVPQPILEIVIDEVAKTLGVPPDSVAVVATETGIWPSSCLGLAEPGELCLAVITFGWRITLEAGDRGGIWRINSTGIKIRLEVLY